MKLSSSGPPSPHIISGEAELLKAPVRFALVGVCYISEEHARLSGPPHHRDHSLFTELITFHLNVHQSKLSKKIDQMATYIQFEATLLRRFRFMS